MDHLKFLAISSSLKIQQSSRRYVDVNPYLVAHCPNVSIIVHEHHKTSILYTLTILHESVLNN